MRLTTRKTSAIEEISNEAFLKEINKRFPPPPWRVFPLEASASSNERNYIASWIGTSNRLKVYLLNTLSLIKNWTRYLLLVRPALYRRAFWRQSCISGTTNRPTRAQRKSRLRKDAMTDPYAAVTARKMTCCRAGGLGLQKKLVLLNNWNSVVRVLSTVQYR